MEAFFVVAMALAVLGVGALAVAGAAYALRLCAADEPGRAR